MGTALQASLEKAKIVSGSRSLRSSKKMPPSPRVSPRCLPAVLARQSFLRALEHSVWSEMWLRAHSVVNTLLNTIDGG